MLRLIERRSGHRRQALEYKGLIFAYLGPGDTVPEFPIFDTFEIPGVEMVPYTCLFACNWLQVTENGIDLRV